MNIIFCAAIIFIVLNLINVSKAKSDAEEINDIMCKKDKRGKDWYKGIMCCQSLNCYHLKKKTELNIEVRAELFNTHPLTEKARAGGCDRSSDYVETMKNKAADLRGDMRDECADEDGVKERMQLKVDCFKECAKGKFTIAKKRCPKLFEK